MVVEPWGNADWWKVSCCVCTRVLTRVIEEYVPFIMVFLQEGDQGFGGFNGGTREGCDKRKPGRWKQLVENVVRNGVWVLLGHDRALRRMTQGRQDDSKATT